MVKADEDDVFPHHSLWLHIKNDMMFKNYLLSPSSKLPSLPSKLPSPLSPLGPEADRIRSANRLNGSDWIQTFPGPRSVLRWYRQHEERIIHLPLIFA